MIRVDTELAGCRVALERIAAALEALLVPLETASTESPACLHPAELRIDFGITNGQEDFQCRKCGFRSVAPQEG